LYNFKQENKLKSNRYTNI